MYGALASIVDTQNNSKSTVERNLGHDRYASRMTKALDRVLSIQVPHNWFLHFYAFSVVMSVFWAFQILLGGRAYEAFLSSSEKTSSSMNLHQTLTTWLLMAIQGFRRLYECYTLQKPSSSKMWFGHWLLGFCFYMAMSIAVWIEGGRK